MSLALFGMISPGEFFGATVGTAPWTAMRRASSSEARSWAAWLTSAAILVFSQRVPGRGLRQFDLAIIKYIPFRFISDESRLRLRLDIINLFNDRNFVDYNNNPADNTRTPSSPTIYREISGIGVGGNPPRTVKVSAGFSF